MRGLPTEQSQNKKQCYR